MGAKESAEMKVARDLIMQEKMPVCAAAKQAGISYAAIYMSKWYKSWKKTQKYVIKK